MMIDKFFLLGDEQEEMDFIPMVTIEAEHEDDKSFEIPESLPLLPLRNMVLFPGVVMPITVGRESSLKAVQAARKSGQLIGVVAQKDPEIEEPGYDDLYKTGTVARIVKTIKMPDGSSTVLIQGKKRIRLLELRSSEPYLSGYVKILDDVMPDDDTELMALMASMKDLAERIISLNPQIPKEVNVFLQNVDNPVFLMHMIASNMRIPVNKKQDILEKGDLIQRGQQVLRHMYEELNMLELKNQIQNKVKSDIEKQQRDFFLNQQLKTIQEELGGDTLDQEIKQLKERAAKMKWPKHVDETFNREVEKLQRVNPASPEYSVIMNYLELLLDLPWGKYSKDSFDLKRAKDILDRDHYGLEKVKDRILEYLAVLQLKGDMKSPILCLVGPPGVGKTSLGKSIAKALKRRYVRMSLGGLHDEAEIRGHRKTYIGAMPGRIIQSLKKAKTSNPVYILDEIDKVGTDFRGDPSSALLEVLDPEQNDSFYDNYLELEYDLSKVLFIATANTLNTIAPALRDRMEVIFLNGYSIEEKVEIARRHLVPKQRKAHGLKGTQIRIPVKTLEKLVEEYTRESGVRELDRKLAAIMRWTARQIAMGEAKSVTIKPEDLHKILGPVPYEKESYQEDLPAGVAVGLAWTPTGGDTLYVETALSKGKGRLTLTGNLGDVMKESATTALTFLKAHADELNIPYEHFDTYNIHLHVPEGAIPKDGPSAGITMLTSLASVFTGRKVKKIAMTGEITLRGKILPVGGIKEKILAAKRAGLEEIMLPKANKKDIEEIKPEFIKTMKFHFVDNMMEALNIALEKARSKPAEELLIS